LSHLPAIVFTLLLLTLPPPPSSTLFPYTTLFRSLDEIGKVYGVTRERIRQIEKKTLEMLRHPSRSDALRDYARWLFGIPVRPTHQEHADSGTIPIVSRRAPSADSASPGVNQTRMSTAPIADSGPWSKTMPAAPTSPTALRPLDPDRSPPAGFDLDLQTEPTTPLFDVDAHRARALF